MLNSNFSPWPSFTEEEASAVRDVILSNKVNYWTGQECRQFENEFANFANSKYAVAVSNGTLALDLALKTLNLQSDDEVIVTPRTFLASVSCVVTAGAIPIFADVDLNSQNISATTIKPLITNKTKAIIVVHLAGAPADMDGIMKLAKEYNLFVIEDCAQAHGAKYKGRSVGSIGHVGAWSFCQDKIMTTGGEGGMVTTNSKDLWKEMWAYKDHGKDYDSIYHKEHPPGFRWLHNSFGTNWRMTEVQAAIGRIQLKKMHDWNKKRVHYANMIWNACKKFQTLRVPTLTCENCIYTNDNVGKCIHAAYKCYVFVKTANLPKDWNRDRIMNTIVAKGVPCFSGSCSEVYLEKAFDNTTYRPVERLENAKELGESSLMFLVHPTLKMEEIQLTCQVIEEVFNQIEFIK